MNSSVFEHEKNKTAEQMLNAIEIITEKYLEKASFDKTIKATIIECTNASKGEYKCRFQDALIYAYSADLTIDYPVDTLVYVLVPRNDMTETKTILGTVDKLGTDYVRTISQISKFDPIGDNVFDTPIDNFLSINTWVGDSYILYDKENNIDLLTFNQNKFNDYFLNESCNYFEISIDFKTDIETRQDVSKGHYGIRIYASNRIYEFNNTYFIGEPFNLHDFTTQKQQFVFDAEAFGELQKIEVFAEGFIHEPDHDPDIFFQQVKFTALHALTPAEMVGLYLSIVTPSGSIFYNQDMESLELIARVRRDGGIDDSEDIQYYWFQEDARVHRNSSPQYAEYYKTIQGANTEGWKYLNNTLQTLIVQRRQMLASKITYKCIVVYGENVLEKEIVVENRTAQYEIIINSSNGVLFYRDAGSTVLDCVIMKNGIPLEGDISYSWGSYTRYGVFSTYPWNTRLTDVIEAKTIDLFTKYICTIHADGLDIGSGFVTLKNLQDMDSGYTLTIKHSDQTFKYDESGISPTSPSLENPLLIQPIEIEFFNNQGETINPDQLETIKWYIPKDNTMLLRTDPRDYEEDGDYWVTKAEKVAGIDFLITDDYDFNAINNQILVTAIYNGSTYRTSTQFAFFKEGDLGTNGTAFSCKIVPNTNEIFNENKVLIYELANNSWHFNFTPRSNEFPFRLVLYQNSKVIFDNSETGPTIAGDGYVTIKWDILNKSSTSVFSIQNDRNFVYTPPFPSAVPNIQNFNNILKVTVNINLAGGKTLYNFLPIGVVKSVLQGFDGWTIKVNEGFDRVLYNADGISPLYNTKPFEILFIDAQQHQQEVNYSIYTMGKNLKHYPIDSGLETLIPADTYDGLDTTQALVLKNSNFIVYLPIIFSINRYGFASLNAWDGTSIQISEEGGYIYSPIVGAGKKEDDNSFTGVLMGSVETVASDQTIKDEVGLFAYGSGQRTVFIDAESGKAEFGVGDAKILLDPADTTAKIYGGNYNTSLGTGMLIDLSEPRIKFGSGNFDIGPDGMLQAIKIRLKRNPNLDFYYFNLSKMGFLLDVGDGTYPYEDPNLHLNPFEDRYENVEQYRRFVFMNSSIDPSTSKINTGQTNAIAEFSSTGIVLQNLRTQSYLKLKDDTSGMPTRPGTAALKAGNSLYLESGLTEVDPNSEDTAAGSVNIKSSYNANVYSAHGINIGVSTMNDDGSTYKPAPYLDDTYGYIKVTSQYGWIYMSKTAGGKKNTPGIGINAYKATSSKRVDPPDWPYTGQDYKVYINGHEILTNGNIADATNGDIGGVAYVSEFGNIRPYLDKLVSLGSYYEEGDGIAAWRHVVTYDTIQVSDRREKDCIQDLDKRYVDFIMNLRPKKYKYRKTREEEYRTGFIAQEVEDVLDDVGLRNKDFGGLKKKPIIMNGQVVDYGYGLNYDDFVAALVLTVQDLQKQINDLKGELKHGT